MTEQVYSVILKKDVDYDQFHQDMIADYGTDCIPARSVQVVNLKPGSRRITYYALEPSEVDQLKQDSRVYAIEIPPELNPDIIIHRNLEQSGTWTKTSSITSSDLNWGLLRGVFRATPWGTGTSITDGYPYLLTGKGVDVVIQDGGITPSHTEWNDSDGVSRLQQIDWYTESGLAGAQSSNHYLDYDGHGSHVAGTAAGRTQGWARDARIYAVKFDSLSGSEGGGLPSSDIFDVIKLWHRNKPVTNTGYKRPTIVNMSWGSSYNLGTTLPEQIFYRGQTYFEGTDYTTITELRSNYGWIGNQSFGNYRSPAYSATYEVEVQELLDEGVHVVVAAGNSRYKIDTSTGLDYNNTVGGFGNTWYHRGSAPGSQVAINVGNIDVGYANNLERKAYSSESGPGVQVYAPGTHIISVSSTDNASGTNDIQAFGYTRVQHPDNPTDYLMKISGTSMAAPQVTGMLACVLQANPGMTPAQLKQYLENNATTDELYDTSAGASDTDYNASYSLVGGNNRTFYMPMQGITDGAITGALTISDAALHLDGTEPTTPPVPGAPTYTLSSSASTVQEGGSFTITLTTTNVDNGTQVAYTLSGAAFGDTDAPATVGNFTINNNTASVTFGVIDDGVAEGDETFILSLDNGEDSISITLQDTGGGGGEGGGPTNWNFAVENNGSGSYVFSGDASGQNIGINVTAGDTLIFDITAPGHPFWIRTTQTTGQIDDLGIPNNGTQLGVITWTIPTGLSGTTVYYNCEFHSSMSGPINIA